DRGLKTRHLRVNEYTPLILLLHYEPTPLFVAEIKFRNCAAASAAFSFAASTVPRYWSCFLRSDTRQLGSLASRLVLFFFAFMSRSCCMEPPGANGGHTAGFTFRSGYSMRSTVAATIFNPGPAWLYVPKLIPATA